MTCRIFRLSLDGVYHAEGHRRVGDNNDVGSVTMIVVGEVYAGLLPSDLQLLINFLGQAERPMFAPPDTRGTRARGTPRAEVPLATNGQAPVLPVCLPVPR